VPELTRLDGKWFHKPHEAPPKALAAAGIVRGKTYPDPIVSHTIAREVALEEYGRIKGRRKES
jgi:deoxyribodipyrimidine photo-lyase